MQGRSMQNQQSGFIVTNPRRPRGLFSLKWKALLFTTLVLVAVIVTISLRNYFNLNAQFDRYREQARAGYTRDIEALVGQSLLRLRQLGGLIPALPGMEQALISADIDSIEQALDPQLPVLQVDWGVDALGWYDDSSKLLARWEAGRAVWEQTPWEEGRNQQILSWITRVNASDQPVEAISCNPACMQYAAVPILARGQSVGVLLVGSLLADVVNGFREIAGNDIGVLVTGEPILLMADQSRSVSAWDAVLVAITQPPDATISADRNVAILRAVADAVPLAAAVAGVRTTLNGVSYEVSMSPLPRFVGSGLAYVGVIADISDTLNQIRDATREIVLVGLMGWLLSELLLLAILWTPMSRLRLTARNLPLLANRQFQAVRTAILEQSRRHVLYDEIDILDDTAIALADRLEQLEQRVEERTQALSGRMEELALERDFIASLLSSAQVVIVTQDTQGRMMMANPFAQSITGYGQAELIGQKFVDLLFPDASNPDLRKAFKELRSRKREHLRHESLMTCKDGSIRSVTWYHSRLTVRSPDDPVLLSVGLDITERRGVESRLNWLADHDSLTGLLNRHRFQEELELLITASQRQGKTGALLLIDLDQFKYINDTSGHQSGDALLQVVANALVDKIVVADVVARLGGDEFGVLVRQTDAEGVAQVAAAINDLLADVGLTVKGQSLRVSASIGIALFPDHGYTVSDLMANADVAMYQAKEEGRGHWRMFSDEDQSLERLLSRVYWKDRVARALGEDRFILYYQPIMAINTGTISHYEVLLKMQDDDGSVISAGRFIEAAERGGVIHALDRMVVRKAIEALAEVTARGWDVAFSINLSGHVFSDPEMLPHLRHTLEQTRVDPLKVIFEITETAAVSDFAVANDLMLSIKELGCRFALDDFGIGFASFYYLKHLPMDFLKIDGSFIGQLPDSIEDQIIVRAMSQAAKGFGKITVAEYVEDRMTLNLLREYGIDYAQGYLISEPLSADIAFAEDVTAKKLTRLKGSGNPDLKAL